MYLGIELLKQRHQETCINGGGLLCLLFGEDGRTEFDSAKIIGRGDNPGDWLAVAKDIGRGCLAVIELPPLPKRRFLRNLESVLLKEINILIRRGNPAEIKWSRGETALRNFMNTTGVLSGIIAMLAETFAPERLPQPA